MAALLPRPIPPRLGIDLGGTKIEIAALQNGAELLRRRIATPKSYDAMIAAVAGLVREADAELGVRGSVGMAIPGTETAQGLIKNANTVWLNGKPLGADLAAALGRSVRLANDANCFVLSEATDGAAAGAGTVFGVIAGTGLGGGIVIDGKVLGGAHGVGGEWGHIPLPGMTPEEWTQAPECYCGKRGCLETWCCGTALAADYLRYNEGALSAEQIAAGDSGAARDALARLTDRLARGLATLVNILDPDVIVLGGGLSNVESLYRDLPPLVERYGFTLGGAPKIVKNKHGDSSGVRGAAWLWPE